MASDPIYMKKLLLSMKADDITKSFIENNFGYFYDKKTKKIQPPKFKLNDKVTLEANAMNNSSKIETTLGRIMTNKFLFEDGLYGIVSYVNEPLGDKRLAKVEEKIADALLAKKVDPEVISRYYDRVQWLGLTVHSIVTTSFSERTISPIPEVLKLKKELFEKYKEELEGPRAGIVAVEIENQLLAKAKEILGDDEGMDLYKSGARGSFGNNYKNMMVMRGPVFNKLTGKFEVIQSCLSEGIEKNDIHSWGDAVISGAYPKAVGTKDAGYFTKKFFAAYQTSIIGEPGSDCGSKSYREFKLTKDNYKNVKYRWIFDGGKLICLTPEIASKYFGKTVKMRSPLYCKDTHICSKCAGDLFYRLNIKNIGLTTADISSTYLNRLMKSFHSAVVEIYSVDIDKMLL